jgi:hypothetical protein
LPPDPIVVHPSVLTAMLKLLPCLSGSESGSRTDPELERITLTLQFHLAEMIKSLMRIEKNQQVDFSTFSRQIMHIFQTIKLIYKGFFF